MSTFCFWPRTRALRITKLIICAHRDIAKHLVARGISDAALC
jgi:hypothetical protein